MKEKGVALFLVLATILIVVILGNIVLHIISSQSRLTHHQVSRIQAYYANLAGMNYALEQLRTGVWRAEPPPGQNDCPLSHPCRFPPVQDPDFPRSIRSIEIVLTPPNTPPCNSENVCIDISSNYTYSQTLP